MSCIIIWFWIVLLSPNCLKRTKYLRQIIRLKYCKLCRYKFKKHLTVTMKVWTCYPIDTAVINDEKKGWNLSIWSQHNGCALLFHITSQLQGSVLYGDYGRSKGFEVGGGGGRSQRILHEIWTSMLKIYLKVIILIQLFLIDFHCHTKFPKKRVVWGSSPRNFFTFLKLHDCISGIF